MSETDDRAGGGRMGTGTRPAVPPATDADSRMIGDDAPDAIARRKLRHVDVCLTMDVGYTTLTNGFERHRLPYTALPEVDLQAVDLSTELFSKRLRAPFLIGAMTGGSRLARLVNRNLATAAEHLGVGLMLGSQRIMIEQPDAVASFQIRDVAPDALLLGNLGVAQLGLGYGRRELLYAVEAIGADGLAIHANPLQEAVQPTGNTNFAGLVPRLAELVPDLPFPVVLKEVGHGLAADVIRRVAHVGFAGFDVAGAGGTSWSKVEQLTASGEITHPQLAEWGIPTAEALVAARTVAPHTPIVASGGIRTGVEAAKALALGADVVAVARPLLEPATTSPDAVVAWVERFVEELRIALFCTGSSTVAEVRGRCM
jgi:isopentenyl-diphosphate delta-isomerase